MLLLIMICYSSSLHSGSLLAWSEHNNLARPSSRFQQITTTLPQ